MAKTKKQETAVPVTRAEKTHAAKTLIKEILTKKSYKHNDLIEKAAKLYAEKFGGEDTENVNDVKGRVGSVLDIMKKEGEVAYDGGMYALNSAQEQPVTQPTAEEKKEPKQKKKAPKKETAQPVEEVKSALQEQLTAVEETAPAKKAKAKSNKKQSIPPIAEQEPAPAAKTEEKSAAKAKKKTVKKAEEQPAQESKEKKTKAPRAKATEKQAPVAQDIAPADKTTEQQPTVTPIEKPNTGLVVKEKAEMVKKEVVDMSFLFGGLKTPNAGQTVAPVEKTTAKTSEQQSAGQAVAPIEKSEQKPETKSETKPETKPENKPENKRINVRKLAQDTVKKLPTKAPQKPVTADERLREAFLRRLRQLGGEYFEYYSVYLLERYSMKNGRRLEGMRISGGGRDGGIDGEIELTDRFGFKETIYIQSKNWDPSKGDEKLWVVGETLLQQFIGACVCRQAKEGKQNARGIFVTTSRFTPDAKRILEDMSDKIVGYDGEDVYEAAKDCQFGLLYENGNWKLDEKLLSGEKAFFNMF